MRTEIIVTFLLNTVFESYLILRQLKKLFTKNESAKKFYTEEEERQMKTYSKDKLVFDFFKNFYYSISNSFLVYANFYVLLFDAVKIYSGIKGKMASQLLFYATYSLLNTLHNVPVTLISNFVIEKKHNFNKMTLSTYVGDTVKNYLISTAMVSILFYISANIIENIDNFFMPLILCIALFQIAVVICFPIFILPLFNKFEELKEGPLSDKIRAFAESKKFPISKINIMDGSKRSGHSNAFFTGLFTKQIVLYDTLLDGNMTDDEVMAVLAHEIGHWSCYHTYRQLFFALSSEFLLVFAFQKFISTPKVFSEFLNSTEAPLIVRIFYFLDVITVMNVLFAFLHNYMVRGMEREADLYAVKNGFGEELKKALEKLHSENKSDPCPDYLYSIYNQSHPTLQERVDFINLNLKTKSKID